MFTDEEVTKATQNPPTDTRAYFRGTCMSRFPAEIAAASWDSVVFDIPGRPHLLRVPTLDPTRGSRQHVQDLLDASQTAEQLVTALSAAP